MPGVYLTTLALLARVSHVAVKLHDLFLFMFEIMGLWITTSYRTSVFGDECPHLGKGSILYSQKKKSITHFISYEEKAPFAYFMDA
ncbi:hypothetical protein F4680DRAFT_424814 [Xylaria scruposa]|nr:hypothetical protein F4680DRAFT_424814 [Xylaria scruposa]